MTTQTPKHPDKDAAPLPKQKTEHSFPPAGPHAKDHLIDNEKTPGTGLLSSKNKKGDVDPGGG